MFDVELSTYVDLAVSIVSQSRRYRESQTATSCYPGTESNLISQGKMRSEWMGRIKPWLVERTHHYPFDEIENLKDFTFSAFFLQYTVPAMHLWNVMQEFYELDRVVCWNSEESEVTINNWKLLGFFEYLKAKKVEKKWRNSLDAIKRSTEPRSGGSLKSLASGDGMISPANRALPTELRIASMEYGVDTLAEAWKALQRSCAENLNGPRIQQLMLSEIQVAVERRFMMVDSALRQDGDADSLGDIKQLGNTSMWFYLVTLLNRSLHR
jgi:hypothetical protein